MGLSVSEREAFRKSVKNMISQKTKSDLEAYFSKQGISRSTIHYAINLMVFHMKSNTSQKFIAFKI
ncbi:hypothetical protein BpHYR1_024201 [Brachionus plicatilis]|uniref:Uncharacterized protein n=1 Tax=Brachionus plicatilis TaxID=10195 RepID=A0A3M7SIT9_BRAPC|nr:hypothetical protein BpHYR1_024201 [Brachionus plicatilis]